MGSQRPFGGRMPPVRFCSPNLIGLSRFTPRSGGILPPNVRDRHLSRVESLPRRGGLLETSPDRDRALGSQRPFGGRMPPVRFCSPTLIGLSRFTPVAAASCRRMCAAVIQREWSLDPGPADCWRRHQTGTALRAINDLSAAGCRRYVSARQLSSGFRGSPPRSGGILPPSVRGRHPNASGVSTPARRIAGDVTRQGPHSRQSTSFRRQDAAGTCCTSGPCLYWLSFAASSMR